MGEILKIARSLAVSAGWETAQQKGDHAVQLLNNQIDSFTQLAVLAEEKSRREREVGLSFAMATSESWPLQDGDVLRQGLRRGWLVTLKAYETFISACSQFHTRPEKQSLQDYPSPSKGRKRVMGNLAG